MPRLLASQIASLPTRRTEPLWTGPCGDGPNGGITQSMLKRFLSCRERFRIKYVLGLEPHEKWEKTSGYGNMWHVCEETLAGVGGPRSDSRIWPEVWAHLNDHCRTQVQRFPTQLEEIEKWWNVCKVQFFEYVKYWAEHPDVKNRIPLMQEQSFDVPYKLPSGRIARLRGKFDSVDLIDGGIYLQENKTKGDIDEIQLQRQMKFDCQTMMYLVALQSVMISRWRNSIRGVRYNVVRRPLSGGKGSIKPHGAKATKTKMTPAETDAQFYERLRRDYIAAEPSYWFFRLRCEVSQRDVDTFKQQFLTPILENLADEYEWWEWCFRNSVDVFDGERRQAGFPDHCPRHWRYPFGGYNPLDEGGATEYDAMLETGSESGLRQVDKLFKELA